MATLVQHCGDGMVRAQGGVEAAGGGVRGDADGGSGGEGRVAAKDRASALGTALCSELGTMRSLLALLSVAKLSLFRGPSLPLPVSRRLFWRQWSDHAR